MSDTAFCFADLAGFTALSEAHGDLDAADVAGRFSSLVRRICPSSVLLVKTIGDAVMLASADPWTLLRVVLDVGLAVEAEPMFPAVRTGLHSGSVVERDGDFFGSTVNLAARVAAEARAGQILCTESVAHAVDVDAADVIPLGDVRLKNVPGTVALFEIRDRRRVSIDVEVDPVCRMQVPRGTAPARLPYQERSYAFCSFACAKLFADAPTEYVAG